MRITLESENRKIVASGTVIAHSENSDISFNICDDLGDRYITLKLIFDFDRTGKQIINRTINNNIAEWKCMNFSNNGTGTSIPVEVGTYGNEKLFLRFWSTLEGDMYNTGKTRKVDYTFYTEGQVNENAQ